MKIAKFDVMLERIWREDRHLIAWQFPEWYFTFNLIARKAFGRKNITPGLSDRTDARIAFVEKICGS